MEVNYMKKLFEEPEVKVQPITVEDIIMESGGGWIPGENEGEGDQL